MALGTRHGRESLRPTDSLVLYRASFDHGSRRSDSAERTEIVVGAEPGDEVSEIRVVLRSVPLASTSPLPILHIATAGGASLEITRLTSADPMVSLRVHADTSGTTILATGNIDAVSDLELGFQLWEACSPLRGTSPYLYSVLSLAIGVPFAPSRSVLITLETPATVGPRSTQGNFTLAYPSRLDSGKRLTNIYFRTSPTQLTYRFANNSGLTAPWLNLGRAGVAALLLFIVVALATKLGEGDRFSALIAVFVAVTGVVWDFSREIASFSVYNATKSWIQKTVLGAQVAVLALLATAVIGLTTAPGALQFVGLASAIATSALIVTSIAALVAHTYGFWQGFVCDHKGCRHVFRWRRARPECHYTGRVFCNLHLVSICDSCVHGSDLRTNSLQTAPSYGTIATPCGAVSAELQNET